jgi:hypothetical protein
VGLSAILVSENGSGGQELAEALRDPERLIYAEYVLMMTGPLIQRYVPGDWHKQAWRMRLLRNSFDTADVDGNNSLEAEELEMVRSPIIDAPCTQCLRHGDPILFMMP